MPNQVLTEENYAIAIDESRPLAERQAAFERRANWLRGLDPARAAVHADMVEHFGEFGVIEHRPGPADGAFPPRLLVETEVGFKDKVHPLRGLHPVHVPEARDPAVAEAEIRSAIDASPHPDEQITAGYLTKVARFHGRS